MGMRDDADMLLNAALMILTTEGFVIKDRPEGHPFVLTAELGDLFLRASTHYRRAPRVADPEIQGGPEPNPTSGHPPVNGLDIRRGKRIFSVAWYSGFPITVLRFRRGPWEAAVEAAAWEIEKRSA